jgi:iron(III) transport system substrate-binding protein
MNSRIGIPALVAVAVVALVLAGAVGVLSGGPGPAGSTREVIIYTSVDQVYSEPVLRAFEGKTGIRVRAVYDVEAAKTTGLVNRLLAEKGNPRADVFWNGEIARTLVLKDAGILAPYRSPAAAGIPELYRDPESHWTGFGGRCRVILVNTRFLSASQYPRSLFSLANSSIPPERIGLAYPLFGTTATQAAALYASLGPDKARSFYVELKGKGIRLVDGNSVVRDLVVAGDLWAGLTDSDDACGAVDGGAPVRVIIPDQGPGEAGTLVIPNSVALIAGAPHPQEGQLLIDYLLDPAVERELVLSGWFQLPLRPVDLPGSCLGGEVVRSMPVTFEEIARFQEQSARDLAQIFIR